jgi:hypothetical protein
MREEKNEEKREGKKEEEKEERRKMGGEADVKSGSFKSTRARAPQDASYLFHSLQEYHFR